MIHQNSFIKHILFESGIVSPPLTTVTFKCILSSSIETIQILSSNNVIIKVFKPDLLINPPK